MCLKTGNMGIIIHLYKIIHSSIIYLLGEFVRFLKCVDEFLEVYCNSGSKCNNITLPNKNMMCILVEVM